MIRKYSPILILLCLCCCKTEKRSARIAQNFRDYFVCTCMMTAFDSLVAETYVRPLGYVSQEADVLYYKDIKKLVPKVVRIIYKDSIDKVGHVSEGAQGYDIYRICLEYSRSKEMDSILVEQKKLWDTIRDVDHYILDHLIY